MSSIINIYIYTGIYYAIWTGVSIKNACQNFLAQLTFNFIYNGLASLFIYNLILSVSHDTVIFLRLPTVLHPIWIIQHPQHVICKKSIF